MSGPREACLPEVLSRAVLCTCQLSSCLRGHPICDTRQRRCNSSVVFPVHPATPREGCVSLMPLTFTRKEAVVQTGTFPASGHPGVTVLSASPRQPRQRSALTQVTIWLPQALWELPPSPAGRRARLIVRDLKGPTVWLPPSSLPSPTPCLREKDKERTLSPSRAPHRAHETSQGTGMWVRGWSQPAERPSPFLCCEE